MPQTLHDVVQKALIARGGAYQWGSDKDSSETSKAGFIWYTTASDPSKTYIGISWLPERIQFHYTSTTATSAVGTLSRDHNISSSVARSSSSLGLFSRTDLSSRPMGRHLLLRVPGLLGQRRGVGRVGSHTTSTTVLCRGPECLDQPDPLPWEIWARPIGFMWW
jgi:hypothetical protein